MKSSSRKTNFQHPIWQELGGFEQKYNTGGQWKRYIKQDNSLYWKI